MSKKSTSKSEISVFEFKRLNRLVEMCFEFLKFFYTMGPNLEDVVDESYP